MATYDFWVALSMMPAVEAEFERMGPTHLQRQLSVDLELQRLSWERPHVFDTVLLIAKTMCDEGPARARQTFHAFVQRHRLVMSEAGHVASLSMSYAERLQLAQKMGFRQIDAQAFFAEQDESGHEDEDSMTMAERPRMR